MVGRRFFHALTKSRIHSPVTRRYFALGRRGCIIIGCMRPAEIKASFEQNGYFVARGVFGAGELSKLEEDFDRIVAQLVASGEDVNARWSGSEMDRLDDQKGIVVHTHNVQQYSSRWLRALLDARFLDVAEAILGPDIILQHSKLFQKPAELGAPFPMHQDWQYFRR